MTESKLLHIEKCLRNLEDEWEKEIKPFLYHVNRKDTINKKDAFVPFVQEEVWL